MKPFKIVLEKSVWFKVKDYVYTGESTLQVIRTYNHWYDRIFRSVVRFFGFKYPNSNEIKVKVV
jgi:hypothetical protein